ncbi:trehalose-6-phosphate synthase, partial [Micromonospora aurantiaca]|nr:trehalose-6-phosphate synthase [Micromonospora aurantiaca]
WDAYVRVNKRFAEAAAKVAAKHAIVWVQDYQLQLVPSMLRELRPDLRIGFFLHIPFPPVELFWQLPWR